MAEIMQEYRGHLSDAQKEAVLETAKRINWSAGYGDITAIIWESRQARIERPHMSPTLRSFRLFTDAKRQLRIRFCGRSHIVKKASYSFKEVN